MLEKPNSMYPLLLQSPLRFPPQTGSRKLSLTVILPKDDAKLYIYSIRWCCTITWAWTQHFTIGNTPAQYVLAIQQPADWEVSA